MNQQLIVDEGHSNPMTRVQLEERMRGWIAGEYCAVVFERDARVVAYALYRVDERGVHVRQFFVQRDQRRVGIGREAFALLRSAVVPGQRVAIEVLIDNHPARAFWQALGFKPYAMTMERTAD